MGSIAYNTSTLNIDYVVRATGGGSTFSNASDIANFDYFDDSPTVNDAVYFGSAYPDHVAYLTLNVGTALLGSDVNIVWEYYHNGLKTWCAIPNLTDNTNGFTTTGSNEVTFCVPPYNERATINSIIAYWVRARISSFTSVSEGGANATTTPTLKNSQFSCTGFDVDTDPLTANDLYDWIVANQPEIPVYKRGNYYEFPTAGTFNGFLSKREVLLFGNGSTYRGSTFPYSVFGEESGNVGTNGSILMLCGYSGGTIFSGNYTTFHNSKVFSQAYYDSANDYTAPNVSSLITSRSSYSTSATNYGSILEEAGYLGDTTTMVNCLSSGGSNVTPYNLTDNNTKLGFIYRSTGIIFNIYNNINTVFRGLILDADAGGYAAFNSTCYGSTTMNLINCTPSLSYASGELPAVQVAGLTDSNGSNCTVLYYDESLGTYTNYSTEANTTGSGDVPLSGDVGDIYYFSFSSSSYTAARTTFAFRFLLSDQDNDYGYVWEYYNGTSWVEYPVVLDNTNNFTTGANKWLFLHETIENTSINYTTTTVNGINSCWARLRITTKGTATPVFDRVYGINRWDMNNRWRLNEKYSLDVNVQTTDNTPISGADIVVKDAFGNTAVSTTTDANGDITSQVITRRSYKFDYTNTNSNWITADEFSPYSVTVSKSGYQTKTIYLDVSEETKQVITLEKAVKYIMPEGKKMYWNLKPEDSQNKFEFNA